MIVFDPISGAVEDGKNPSPFWRKFGSQLTAKFNRKYYWVKIIFIISTNKGISVVKMLDFIKPVSYFYTPF